MSCRTSSFVGPIATVVGVHPVAAQAIVDASAASAEEAVEARVVATVFVGTVRTIVEPVAAEFRRKTFAARTSGKGKSKSL